METMEKLATFGINGLSYHVSLSTTGDIVVSRFYSDEDGNPESNPVIMARYPNKGLSHFLRNTLPELLNMASNPIMYDA